MVSTFLLTEEEPVAYSMRTSVIIFFYCISHLSYGQIPVVVHETFDDNRYGWYEHQTAQHKVGLMNGKYFIESPGTGWISYVTPYIEPRKDYSFEATFTQIDGKDDNGFGFVWGHDGKEHTNSFTFTSNGYYRIESADSATGVRGTWQETSHVKKIGEPNKLKVEHKNGKLSFYLNNQLLTTT